MLKRFGNGGLDADRFSSEDVNPMAGVSNLADAMLVLAVGIMLALIIHWKVDVGQQQQAVTEVQQSEMQEITDEFNTVDPDEVTEKMGEDGLQKKGTVYVDPETGKTYLVVTGEE